MRQVSEPSSERPQIVVVTPVRNEDWILPTFLAITSAFADAIIIADQGSTDRSREICGAFPKVTVISNLSEDYNEAERQVQLIREARRRVLGHRIILALDADEIIAADAIHSRGWLTMLNAQPGTVLCFEKPDVLPGLETCVRQQTSWPIGFVDDGSEHSPQYIHSIRVPRPPHATYLTISSIKVLHYAAARPRAHRAKFRLYAVLENLRGQGRSVLRRRRRYGRQAHLPRAFARQDLPQDWLSGWELAGIDVRTIATSQFYWQDFEVLRLFSRHGVKRFWTEDIWDLDWNECNRTAASMCIPNLPHFAIQQPPKTLVAMTQFASYAFSKIDNARARLGREDYTYWA